MICRQLDKEKKKPFVLSTLRSQPNMVKMKAFLPRHLTELARICPVILENGSGSLTENRIVIERHIE